jgi:hypothetical protein
MYDVDKNQFDTPGGQMDYEKRPKGYDGERDDHYDDPAVPVSKRRLIGIGLVEKPVLYVSTKNRSLPLT